MAPSLSLSVAAAGVVAGMAFIGLRSYASFQRLSGSVRISWPNFSRCIKNSVHSVDAIFDASVLLSIFWAILANLKKINYFMMYGKLLSNIHITCYILLIF